ncbi:hypothetical protein [Micromonospora sp. RTGN7]|uniref:GNAT family N-acetyltransferase n=1 Tax=Micromonospora sp. RTGN7 TaxID=3016526 RepID=UPI0029FF49C6|nr:hypothetical protein [Micromonospora sp. RTGN7]
MTLRGYRSADLPLLSGPWLAGELLGLPLEQPPAMVAPAAVEAPKDNTVELCVLPGAAFVCFTELDWVHRRARLEIGVQPGAEDVVTALLKTAVSHGFRVLNLHRLYGWVTPAAAVPVALLQDAGFSCEATIPAGRWIAGRPVDRQIWGAVRHD